MIFLFQLPNSHNFSEYIQNFCYKVSENLKQMNLCVFIISHGFQMLLRDYTEFGENSYNAGIPITQNTDALINPFTRTTTKMKFAWIYDCFISQVSSSAISITKNTDFKAKIETTTFLTCTSSSNGGALSITAAYGGQLWLKSICGNGCSSAGNGNFMYLELYNISMFLVTSHHCASTTAGNYASLLHVTENINVRNFNSSRNSALTGSSLATQSSNGEVLFKFISFEEDESNPGSPLIFEDSTINFTYTNVIHLKSSSSSIVSLISLTQITFDHTYFFDLTFTGFMITGPASTSQVTFFSCSFEGISDIATVDVTTSSSMNGAPPIETYFIRNFGTENCYVLYPYPTQSPIPKPSTIDENWEWWYWLLLALTILLLILLLWYLFLLCCPVCLCCGCHCCPCCKCCRCMFGGGRCEYAHCICDARCGYCKCCKRTSQTEDYDTFNLESDECDEHYSKKLTESSEEDTDKIISNYSKGKATTSKTYSRTKISHMEHAISQLTKDKQKLTQELNERNNIISRQMKQMEQMESDLDNNDEIEDESEDMKEETEESDEEQKKEKGKTNETESDEDSVDPNISSNDDSSNQTTKRRPKITSLKSSQNEAFPIGHHQGATTTIAFTGIHSNPNKGTRNTDIPLVYVDPNKRYRNGRNIFPGVDVFSATMSNNYDELYVLLRRNSSLANKRNRLGCTPLYIAAQRGNLQLCKLLIDMGADLNMPNKYGHSPLHRAACNGHLNVCKLLVSKGCQLDSRTNWGFTPLDRAIQKNKPAVAQFLISKGSSLYAKDNFGNTPFHRLAKHGRTEMISMFMNEGFDVNCRGCDGMTALHFAAEGSFLKTAEVLVSYGADPHIKSQDGRLPVDLAITDSMSQYLNSLI